MPLSKENNHHQVLRRSIQKNCYDGIFVFLVTSLALPCVLALFVQIPRDQLSKAL